MVAIATMLLIYYVTYMIDDLFVLRGRRPGGGGHGLFVEVLLYFEIT